MPHDSDTGMMQQPGAYIIGLILFNSWRQFFLT